MTTERTRHSGGFSIYNPKYREPVTKPLTRRQKLFVAVFGLIAVGLAILFTMLAMTSFKYFIKIIG